MRTVLVRVQPEQFMERIKVIIAGSRSITNYDLVYQACVEAVTRWQMIIVEVVSGQAPGADTLGEQFADAHGIPKKLMPADWDDITVPGAVVRTRRDGTKYNVRAGHMRNEDMGVYADAGILIWDGKSTGTMDMKKRLEAKGKPVYVKLAC